MKNAFFTLLLLGSIFYSCSDPCDDVDCGEFGTCIEGVCECDKGAFGANCGEFYRDSAIGAWEMLTHECDIGNSLSAVLTFSPRSSIDELEITSSITPDLLLIATIDGTTVTISEQDLIFGIPVTYTGTGTINDNNTMNLVLCQEAESQVKRTCTYLLQK